jgi:hypothetical protein
MHYLKKKAGRLTRKNGNLIKNPASPSRQYRNRARQLFIAATYWIVISDDNQQYKQHNQQNKPVVAKSVTHEQSAPPSIFTVFYESQCSLYKILTQNNEK